MCVCFILINNFLITKHESKLLNIVLFYLACCQGQLLWHPVPPQQQNSVGICGSGSSRHSGLAQRGSGRQRVELISASAIKQKVQNPAGRSDSFLFLLHLIFIYFSVSICIN